MGRTNALKVLPRPSFGQICLVFPCFTLREAYRRYISASKEFTRLGLLAFLWIKLNKESMNTKNSHKLHNLVHSSRHTTLKTNIALGN